MDATDYHDHSKSTYKGRVKRQIYLVKSVENLLQNREFDMRLQIWLATFFEKM